MTTKTEIQFLEKIDCNFSYHDRQESLQLIEESSMISVNATFAVIEELCRVPSSERLKISDEALLDLLSLAADKLNHPLKEPIVDTAKKMILGQELAVEGVILKMQTVQQYPGQFAALSILYASCNDKDGKLEPIWNSILNEWHK